MRRKWLAAITAALVLLPMTAGASGDPAAGRTTAGDAPVRLVQVDAEQLPSGMAARAGETVEAVRAAKATPVSQQAEVKVQDRNKNKIFDNLEERMADGKAAREGLAVLVVTRTPPGASPAMSEAMRGMKVDRTFSRAITGFSAKLTLEQIDRLQRMPEVESIQANDRVQITLDSSTYWMGARSARSDFLLNGNLDGNPAYTRKDVVIAVVDTGIDDTHLDLQGKVIGWYDAVDGQPAPYDDHGHGTHVSGIAAGAGAVNPALRGVAPGAALVGVKVLTGEGWGTIDWVIDGVEWVIAHKDQYNVKVLNMSLGAAGCSDGTDALSMAVNAAAEAGITPVVAAGNDGPFTCSIGSPAAAERAITVGRT